MSKRYMFVSYARHDAGRVQPIVEALADEYRRRGLGVEVWVDYKNLAPGTKWASEIMTALQDSFGMLIFVSPEAMAQEWVGRELRAVFDHPERLIIPVILRDTPDIPEELKERQWIDLSNFRFTEADIRRVVKLVADVTEATLSPAAAPPPAPIAAAAAPAIAATIAQEARGPQRAAASTAGPPDSVFVVHGHDNIALTEMESYLTSIGVKPIILTRMGGAVQSLLQKFLTTASAARFAIVIVSADDVGASRLQYEAKGVGERALQFRARQNVILELGFFYGLLGWENVFVIQRPPNKVYPNFESPSDIAGAVFESMDAAGNWRTSLAGKLGQAGFIIRKTAAKKSAKAKPAGAGSKKVAGVAAKDTLRKLLTDSKHPSGRYLKTLCEKTSLSANECRKMLREIGAREVELKTGEGWTLRPRR